MVKNISNTEKLAQDFLKEASQLQNNIEPVKVLKARVYKIGNANVLIRAASEGNRNYFFGINYITVEEMANLHNPFIAFICGSIKRTVIIPAVVLFDNLNKISHDRNGEYKINISRDLDLILKGRGNRLNCGGYINNWNSLLLDTNNKSKVITVEESLHSIIQGRLLEIGNLRGFQTFSPDKSKKFNKKTLSSIATLSTCPELQFSDYNLLRKIDVLWFKEKGSHLIPEKAFEIEISTGTWSGVGRLSTLTDYSNVKFYIISDNRNRFNQVIQSFPVYKERFKHITPIQIGDLYSAEKSINELRYKIGL
ncbi:MAG TPA: hypothetical protein ENK44_07585 [Caldithrix abyssi]|uniref:Uncharacterized protein n=1 Tax=Caldithrix abyssi TaxID=187145 RepID=A0A7V4U0U0_CALAY|nr:hypothetical protein [Caldithrix abyssi]